jgi:tetratricopeptide (TPR) repeat protein
MNSRKTSSDNTTAPERDASREFLLGRRGKKHATGNGSQAGSLSFGHPMIQDQPFVQLVRDETAAVQRFGLLVVKPDPPMSEKSSQHPESVMCHAKEIAGIVQEICDREGGIWGAVDGELLGCCLLGSDIKASLAISQEIQQQVSGLKNGSVSVGAAAFPMLAYDRGQIVENALKALVHASFFGPGSVVAFDAVTLNISGDTLYQAGDIEAAAKEFERGLRIDPREENLHNSLGVCYGVQGDQHRAIKAFENALEINPENVMALHNTGYSKSILDDTEGALTCFRRAHELDDSLFEVAFHAGRLLVGADRLEEGRRFLEKAVTINPKAGVGHFFLGECYRKMERTDQAIQAYSAAVKRNPNDGAALSALGSLYDETGENPEIAMLFCEKGVELEPENGLYLYRLGRVLLKHGKMHAALDMFEKAQTFGYEAADRISAVKAELENCACLDAHRQA